MIVQASICLHFIPAMPTGVILPVDGGASIGF